MRTLADAIALVDSTLREKSETYGKTYRKVGEALSVPCQYSLIVRMLEKIFRLNNILTGFSQTVQRKDVAEEFLDIACYAVLGLFESSSSEDQSEIGLADSRYMEYKEGKPKKKGGGYLNPEY